MERGHTAPDHREYEDLLAAAALGALTPEEHALLRRHLETCESCRSTLGALLAVADAIPLQVEEREPSALVRSRLRAQVLPEAITTLSAHRPAVSTPASFDPDLTRREGTRPAARAKPGQPRLGWALWGALAAAVLVIAVLSGVVVERVFLQDDEPEPETIALQYPAELQLENASLTYTPDQQLLRFSAADLPEPPEGNVYQVWLFEGETPRPFGVIEPETGNFVTTVDRGQYGAFAVTIEPGPIGSPDPTTSPVILAPLDDAG